MVISCVLWPKRGRKSEKERSEDASDSGWKKEENKIKIQCRYGNRKRACKCVVRR